MGLDFGIYLQDKKDADKYFKKYGKSKNLDYLDNKKEIFWCCGRPLCTITCAIEELGKKDKNDNVFVKLSDLKKDFVDTLEELEGFYCITNWKRNGYTVDYYDNEVLGYSEKELARYEELIADFNDLSKYEGVSEKVISIVRKIDREYINELRQKLDFKHELGDKYVESITEIDPRLQDIVYDGGYMYSYIKLCQTIKNCIELFGEDYKIKVVNSY